MTQAREGETMLRKFQPKRRLQLGVLILLAVAIPWQAVSAQDFSALLKAVEKFDTDLKQLVQQEAATRTKEIATLQSSMQELQKAIGQTSGEAGTDWSIQIAELTAAILEMKADLMRMQGQTSQDELSQELVLLQAEMASLRTEMHGGSPALASTRSGRSSVSTMSFSPPTANLRTDDDANSWAGCGRWSTKVCGRRFAITRMLPIPSPLSKMTCCKEGPRRLRLQSRSSTRSRAEVDHRARFAIAIGVAIAIDGFGGTWIRSIPIPIAIAIATVPQTCSFYHGWYCTLRRNMFAAP